MTISSEDFRNALRHFPAGVTIVTINSPGTEQPHGLTVSAFASVSPVPPLVLVCLDHHSSGHDLLQAAGATFAVNILAQDQVEMSNRFAWVKDEDRFALGEWETAATGAPVLKNALAWLDCTLYASYEAGTHTIYVGEVQASGAPRAEEAPLIYWNRDYRRLEV